MDELNENYNKEIESRKKNQSELKNIITDLKYTVSQFSRSVVSDSL